MSYFAVENGVEPLYVRDMSRELSIRDLSSIFKIYGLLRRESPDIVHTHTAKAGTVGRIATFIYRWLTWSTLIGRPRRVCAVHTFHGHVFHSYYGRFKTRIFLSIEKVLARIATKRIIVISPQQLHEISAKFRIGKPIQFDVIPLGIDTASVRSQVSKRAGFRGEIGVSENDVVVGFVGRLTEVKNLSHLLRVAAMYNNLSRSAKPTLKFVIVGDGHLHESLRLEADNLGILKTLTFLGNKTDMAAVYSGLDIVALTSRNEGTPLSLIEGMAAGRPFISTVVGGVVDLLGDARESQNGYSICQRGVGVYSDSVESYLDGLMLLAGDKDLRRAMGLAGQTYADEQYGKQRLVDDIKDLYRSLASTSLS